MRYFRRLICDRRLKDENINIKATENEIALTLYCERVSAICRPCGQWTYGYVESSYSINISLVFAIL